MYIMYFLYGSANLELGGQMPLLLAVGKFKQLDLVCASRVGLCPQASRKYFLAKALKGWKVRNIITELKPVKTFHFSE